MIDTDLEIEFNIVIRVIITIPIPYHFRLIDSFDPQFAIHCFRDLSLVLNQTFYHLVSTQCYLDHIGVPYWGDSLQNTAIISRTSFKLPLICLI